MKELIKTNKFLMNLFTWKGQNQIHFIMPISETWLYVLNNEIFSLEISYTYWHACSK